MSNKEMPQELHWITILDEEYTKIPLSDLILDMYQQCVWTLLSNVPYPVFASNPLIEYIHFHRDTVAYCITCLCRMSDIVDWQQKSVETA